MCSSDLSACTGVARPPERFRRETSLDGTNRLQRDSSSPSRRRAWSTSPSEPITVRFAVFPIDGKTTWWSVSGIESVRSTGLRWSPDRQRDLYRNGDHGSRSGRWGRCNGRYRLIARGSAHRGCRCRSARCDDGCSRGRLRGICDSRRRRQRWQGSRCWVLGRDNRRILWLLRACGERIRGRQPEGCTQCDSRRQDPRRTCGVSISTLSFNRHRVHPIHGSRRGRRRGRRACHHRFRCGEVAHS